jgi:predicted nuclease of restriction endonuclease-like (RecB) superfamily
MSEGKSQSVLDASVNTTALLADLRHLIHDAKQQATLAVNARLTMMYWHMGKRILSEILNGERAEYGKAVMASLSVSLAAEFGRGFEEKNLRRMVQFAEAFPDESIVATLWRQLSWSHFRVLLPLNRPLQREFYAEMCRIEAWSVRTLSERIDSMLYERTALSSQPEELIQKELAALRSQGQLSPALILKDPYVLDFLDLQDRHLERNLEDAILYEMEQFILELGSGFAFVARQKRLQIDNDDFYIDLLFYNRKLKRLIAIDLKVGDFKAEHKGQMELYLRWLAKYEQETDELPPLGIILCTGKRQEQIELLELNKSGIHVAEYLTLLPPKDVFQQRLQQAIDNAQQRLHCRVDHNNLNDKD